MKPFSIVAFAASLLVGSAAMAAEFVPHRAHYTFKLITAKSSSGIANLDGEMAADWDQSCDGWTLNQKSTLNMYGPDGNRRVSLSSTISTWESADGRDYRFTVRNQTNEAEPEVIVGKARIPSARKAGWVDFTSPRPGRVPLPIGAVFPTRHTVIVLEAMARAPTIVSKVVFDGLTLEGLHEINAVIGKPRTVPSDLPALSKKKSWPVHLAFFGVRATKAVPEHEISVRLFDNGVGDDMVLDFGDFTVRAKLSRVELGKAPTCR